MTDVNIVPASYKDPAGFVFKHNQQFYRQVNKVYAAHYDHLLQSGLYKILMEKKLLIEHREVDHINSGIDNHYKTLLPTQLEFISYPYEWSFDMLKDAALLTLEINNIATQYGMILKDATAFNIQFHKGNPIFIDTLSFEKYDESKPWIAYRQFCECFLFPLYLCHYVRTDAQRWLTIYPDGINVTTTASLLPMRSRLNLGVWLHVMLQRNISQKKLINPASKIIFSKQKMIHLINGLISTIKLLNPVIDTIWSHYYSDTILSNDYLKEKEKIFREYLQLTSAETAIDLGANDGFFSQILAENNIEIIAVDSDSNCINQLYSDLKKRRTENILPLILDITNPTPPVGFENTERLAFFDRCRYTLAIALALIHHLSISKNIPLPRIADFLQKICNVLIIEFIGKEDPKVQELLKRKEDIYEDYTESKFEKSFTSYFTISQKKQIPGTHRILYLMQRKQQH